MKSRPPLHDKRTCLALHAHYWPTLADLPCVSSKTEPFCSIAPLSRDLHQVDLYGTQQPIALLHFLVSRGNLYDRGRDLSLKQIKVRFSWFPRMQRASHNLRLAQSMHSSWCAFVNDSLFENRRSSTATL